MSAEILLAPLSGLVLALKDVPDPAFSKGWLGDGIAIDPIDNAVRAPCPGRVLRVAGNGHAVELLSDAGAALLLHVGVDSHACGCFAPQVAVGDRVAAGDTLIRFDPTVLAGYLRFLIAKLVVTNSAAFRVRPVADCGAIQARAPLLALAPR